VLVDAELDFSRSSNPRAPSCRLLAVSRSAARAALHAGQPRSRSGGFPLGGVFKALSNGKVPNAKQRDEEANAGATPTSSSTRKPVAGGSPSPEAPCSRLVRQSLKAGS